MKAMIPGSEFELRKAQAAATRAVIPAAATPAVILEAIPERGGRRGGSSPTLGAEVEDHYGGQRSTGQDIEDNPRNAAADLLFGVAKHRTLKNPEVDV